MAFAEDSDDEDQYEALGVLKNQTEHRNDRHERLDTDGNPVVPVCAQIKMVLSYKAYVHQVIVIGIYPMTILMTSVILPTYGAQWISGCRSFHNVNENKNCPYNYTKFNYYNSLFVSAIGVVAFIFSPYIGRLSDTFGRKPFTLFTLIASLLPRVSILIFNNLWIFWGLWLITGLNGGKDSTSPAMMAHITDVLPNNLNSIGFGLLQAAIGTSLLGACIATTISFIWGDYYVWIAMVILCSFTILYCFIFVPESLSKENRKPLKEKFTPFKYMINLAHIGDNPVVLWVALIQFIRSTFDFGVITIVFVYFNHQLDIDNPKYANLLNTTIFIGAGTCRVLANGVLLPCLRKCGAKDIAVSMISITATFLACVTLVLFGYFTANDTDNDKDLFFYGISPFAIAFGICIGIHRMAQASLNSILTKNLSKKEKGMGLGTVQSMIGLASALAPFAFGFGYNYSIKQYNIPWAVFAIESVLILFAALLIVCPLKSTINKIKKRKRNTRLMVNDKYNLLGSGGSDAGHSLADGYGRKSGDYSLPQEISGSPN